MKKKRYIWGLLIVLASGLISCSPMQGDKIDPPEGDQTGIPRLVVTGTVTNTSGQAVQGIYVAIFGVRAADEPDVLSYNYALTDKEGDYTIVRYRGREFPKEVTVVATDSTGVYEEQLLFAPVTYDTINGQPFNGFVTADFVLNK